MAWNFHEHAQISEAGLQALNRDERASAEALRMMWEEARAQAALCHDLYAPWMPEDRGPSQDARCIPAVSLSALAADHSCGLGDLQDAISSDWAPQAIAAMREVQRETVRARSLRDRQSINRESDITLAEVDRHYLTRAMGSHMHFQLARDVTRGDRDLASQRALEAYLSRALEAGADANATAAFAFFHASAIHFTRRARACRGAAARDAGALQSSCSTRDLLWRAWLSEWFAIHFLEEGFSASHIVGTWGNPAIAKGTHDYYGENGLDVVTWNVQGSYGAQGDGFLRDEDARMGAAAVREALKQLAHAYAPPDEVPPSSPEQSWGALDGLPSASQFNVCRTTAIPAGLHPLAESSLIHAVLQLQPRPSSLAPSMPRFRMEMGVYFGARLEADFVPVTAADHPGVFQWPLQSTARALVGFGGAAPEIVTHDADFDVRIDLGAATRLVEDQSLTPRFGLVARLRVPLFLPLDLPWATYQWIAPRGRNSFQVLHQWANGGWPGRWQRLLLLAPRWTAQFSFGREATVTWFPELADQPAAVVEVQTPIVEFRHIDRAQGRMTSELRAVVGAEARFTRGDFRYVGLYLNLSLGARIYFVP